MSETRDPLRAGRPTRRAVLSLPLVAGLAALTAACGRRGPLEPPPGVANPTLPSEPQVPPPEDKVPDRPFILDGLL